MTKYLILVKHSVPEIEQDQPANTWRLSNEGQRRAQRLAEELLSFEPEIVLSSDEPKSVETAEILSHRLQLDMHTLPGLHEHDRSNVPFLSHDAFQASMRDFFQRPDALVFGRETADQAHNRFYRAVHSILTEYRNNTVIIVAHGTVISLFVARLTGTSDLELWNRLGLPSFVVMDLGSNTVIVKSQIV
jgi:broad specificity phosphatase PhoE